MAFAQKDIERANWYLKQNWAMDHTINKEALAFINQKSEEEPKKVPGDTKTPVKYEDILKRLEEDKPKDKPEEKKWKTEKHQKQADKPLYKMFGILEEQYKEYNKLRSDVDFSPNELGSGSLSSSQPYNTRGFIRPSLADFLPKG